MRENCVFIPCRARYPHPVISSYTFVLLRCESDITSPSGTGRSYPQRELFTARSFPLASRFSTNCFTNLLMDIVGVSVCRGYRWAHHVLGLCSRIIDAFLLWCEGGVRPSGTDFCCLQRDLFWPPPSPLAPRCCIRFALAFAARLEECAY